MLGHALFALLMLAAVQGPPPGIPESARVRGYYTSSSQVVSPTVVATWMTWAQGPADRLDLLVLWRGKPGWFLERRGNTGEGGGERDMLSAMVEYGGRRLTVDMDRKRRIVSLQNRRLEVKPDDNVVLIDGVDVLDRVPATSALRVDPRLEPGQPPIPIILKRTPELLDFLQCHLRVPQARAQSQIDRLCAQVGRGR